MSKGPRFTAARFAVASGPAEVFERVLFKFCNVDSIGLHGAHYRDRAQSRRIPATVIDALRSFSVSEWDLVQVEVRCDNGKFVTATWERVFGQERYWVVVGLGNVARTIIRKTSTGSDGVTVAGPVYELAAQVNRELMAREATG